VLLLAVSVLPSIADARPVAEQLLVNDGRPQIYVRDRQPGQSRVLVVSAKPPSDGVRLDASELRRAERRLERQGRPVD
jgi:hypothetical protein